MFDLKKTNNHHFEGLYRGYYMSAHCLLNLLNELGKRLNVRLVEHFISFFATRLLYSRIQ